jgi:HD superfamily phosphodiesterase
MRVWFYEGHVAAKYSEEIAHKVGANVEIAVLAALLHDIARTQGIMDEPELMNKSLEGTQQLLAAHGYSAGEIAQVKRAIVNHGCHDALPQTEEGKVMASSDALAHLMTDFYLTLARNREWFNDHGTLEEYQNWVLKKIERDYRRKIFYPEYRKLASKRYEALKVVFRPWKAEQRSEE